MDEQSREAERRYNASDKTALDLLALLRVYLRSGHQVSGWLNLYEDYTARATLAVPNTEVAFYALNYLIKFYDRHKLFFQGREVRYAGEDQPTFERDAVLNARISDEPCFRFDPDEIRQRGPLINLPGQRDYPVSVVLVEDLEAEHSGPEEGAEDLVRRDRYANAYEHTQSYGGPEEGGWYREIYTPVGGMFVGLMADAQIHGTRRRRQPRNSTAAVRREAHNFLWRYLHAMGFHRAPTRGNHPIGEVFLEELPPHYQASPEGPYE